jgi:hypothetical protein
MAFLLTTFRPFGSCLMMPRGAGSHGQAERAALDFFRVGIIDDAIHLTAGNDEVSFHNV